MGSLADLLGVHDQLDRLFTSHQEFLLEQRLSDARTALHVYRRLLDLHMHHEEQVVLPVYAKLGPSLRWPVRLYTGQHRRMRELLHGASERLSGISGRGTLARRAILALLDCESTYKHLAEHHDGAERDGLFSALGFALGADAQAEIVDPCLAEWRHAEALLLRAHSRPYLAERSH
jgi:hypothetical protein